ncbi:hypothetical protein Scep_010796 [Stephania cephalantha]|uniref:Peptidase A1 domain-containing protein n=1 Tax=Stephania cephalantha TaxID=152367 RepID=A0AAP0PHD8_9MAGN
MDARVLWILISLYVLVFAISGVVGGGGVFKVQHKYNGLERTVREIKKHDIRRHGRSLIGIDLPLGGDGRPTDSGLYYTKIGIGTPSNDYYVHVDTGSDIFWVNCIECKQCPKKSDLGIDLRLYNPHTSSTGQTVGCDDQFCQTLAQGPVPNCSPGALCEYVMKYGDGSETGGYVVKDVINYDQVSGNLQTTKGNASVTFGYVNCATSVGVVLHQVACSRQSMMATDGILGFGQSSTSVISQLASAKKVRKIFAHCLDSKNGGGIFAIGNVVQPKVQTTPLVPNQPHYNINLENIQVGNDKIPADELGSQTVIDSGTTLAYLPQKLYDPLISKIQYYPTRLSCMISKVRSSDSQTTTANTMEFPSQSFQVNPSI